MTSEDIVSQVLEEVRELRNELREHRNDLTDHMAREEPEIRKITTLYDNLLDGFPNKDPRGHREWHEVEIASQKDKKELIKKIRDYAILGIIGAVVTFSGATFLIGLKETAIKQVVVEAHKHDKKE